jgi:hypothetical protein
MWQMIFDDSARITWDLVLSTYKWPEYSESDESECEETEYEETEYEEPEYDPESDPEVIRELMENKMRAMTTINRLFILEKNMWETIPERLQAEGKTEKYIVIDSDHAQEAIAFEYNDSEELYLWDGKISVQIANDEILSRYRSFVEFINRDISEYPNLQLIFNTTVPLRDFKYVDMHLVYDEELWRHVVLDYTVKYSMNELTPNRPFVVNWIEIGTINSIGISFIDENNVRRFFSIVTNRAGLEEDGRGQILLIEYFSTAS